MEVKETTIECPKVGCSNRLRTPRAMNALSRIDNKTYVCSECGTREAMEDFAGVEKTPFKPGRAN